MLPFANAAKFDAKAAFAEFEKEYEGLLYGYPTMLWGWLDMANNDNLPPPLDIHLVAALFSIGMSSVIWSVLYPPLFYIRRYLPHWTFVV